MYSIGQDTKTFNTAALHSPVERSNSYYNFRAKLDDEANTHHWQELLEGLHLICHETIFM